MATRIGQTLLFFNVFIIDVLVHLLRIYVFLPLKNIPTVLSPRTDLNLDIFFRPLSCRCYWQLTLKVERLLEIPCYSSSL
jgi:hypothetical protein